MSTLNGLGGAGALMPASAVAPMLAMPSFSWDAARRGARSSARAPRPISPGTVVRSNSASPSSFADPGSGRAVQGTGGTPGGHRLGGGVEQHGGDVHPGDPVDERVVGLRDQREAFPGHALHQPDLPQRLGAVQALGEQPSGELLERGVVGRARQRGVADVVARVEVRVVGPHRPALPERHVGEALAVARHQVQAAEDVIDELLRRRRLALEHHHRRHVHVRGRVVLQVQEGRVQRGQAVGVGHSLDCRGFGLPRQRRAILGGFAHVAANREVCPPSQINPAKTA